jgi:hypothetical protein
MLLSPVLVVCPHPHPRPHCLSLLSHHCPRPHHCSTCSPPHKQLLVRLEAGGGVVVRAGGNRFEVRGEGGSLVVGGPWLGWFVSSPAIVCSLDPRNQIKQLLDQDKTKTEREKLPKGPNDAVIVWAYAVGLGSCMDVGMVVAWAWAWVR